MMPNRASRKVIRMNRITSWGLFLFSIASIITGYSLTKTRGSPLSSYSLHLWVEVGFIAFFILHLALSLRTPFFWKRFIEKLRNRKTTHINWLKFGQRVTGWILLVLAFFVIFTGIQWYGVAINDLIPFLFHLRIDILLILLIIVHVVIGTKFALARRHIRGPLITGLLLAILIGASFAVINIDQIGLQPEISNDGGDDLTRAVRVTLDNEIYTFNPTRIQTVRPDLFQPGHFSIFDILIDLHNSGQITLEYHFADDMNTHVIDFINGHPHWWYHVHYDGGWFEYNIFRMDHYPWKEQSTVLFVKEAEEKLNIHYEIFRAETTRKAAMGHELVIPEVQIWGRDSELIFTDVHVTAHNLRNDTFQNGVITAIDVIMSLGDQGKLTYEIQYYTSIGEYAGIVHSYWIEGINEDIAYGGCGFVYEEGSLHGRLLGGNHIHIPADWRILNAPEYVLWFWICL